MHSTLNDIVKIKKGIRSRRISSYDRSGGNEDWIVIEAGESREIVVIEGSGIIKHIWFTIDCPDPMIRRNALIQMYWDGEEKPSVESPLGDFFGQGWGECYNFISLPLAAAPDHGRALNSYLQMPFSDGARVVIKNQSKYPIDKFYYNISFATIKEIQQDLGRFHAWWNRELTEPLPEGENEWELLGAQTKNIDGKENYLFADIRGKGHFVGVNYFVDNPGTMWYGEGDEMFFVDGESWEGCIHGTGTEDFFNSSWCPKEIYMHPYFGYARVNNNMGWLGRTHCYRFMIEDPVYFSKSLRATIEHGHANNLTLDICTVAYWYQLEPHKVFPPMRSPEERQNMPEVTPSDIHLWRHAWRSLKGKGKLWGNER